MSWFGELRRRISSFFRRDDIDRDLRAEMEFHRDMKTEKYRSQGIEESEARARARRQFGNATLLQETGREAWGWTGVEQFLQDVRVALRSMRKTPSFTTASVLTLALGIGATVAVFGIVNAVLLRPFPYKDAGRLMIAPVSVPDFRDLRASTNTLDDLAIWASNLYAVRFGDDTEQILGAIVSDRFFPMLGTAELGRTLSAEDASQPVAVISHRLWTTRFGAVSSCRRMRSQFFGSPESFAGMSVHVPSSRLPCSRTVSSPFRFSFSSSYVPLSQISTVPAPYCPFGISPSKVA